MGGVGGGIKGVRGGFRDANRSNFQKVDWCCAKGRGMMTLSRRGRGGRGDVGGKVQAAGRQNCWSIELWAVILSR
jgi:hypothetical protein